MLPLEGILVLEFCQYMAGPSAGLKLTDLGARVIKIERPKFGEEGRQINIKNLFIDDSSLLFHALNRNKESYTANLKDEEDLINVKKLIQKANVMTHNFRPGVMETLGLDYKTIKVLNPKIIYATITGYGTIGPWAKKPGQDLLAQSISGVTYLTGDKEDPPTPMGLAVADIFSGTHLTQGILAGLIRSTQTGKGALIEVSLLESMIDLQFEGITTYLNGDKYKPTRARNGNAHAFLSAPYGVYKTNDGFLVIALASIKDLGEALGSKAFTKYKNQKTWFEKKDDIMELINNCLIKENSSYWIEKLEAKGIVCEEVFNLEQLIHHEGYQILNFDQVLTLTNGEKIHTTRCPIRINENKIFSTEGAPRVGEHTDQIAKEFNL
ncbi:CaiB/BaiF CoA transferase family protein [Flammeovirga pacifica]|uniref:Carnitine dehydratase n=1 Tax=Flammeovirga pacifica TaxID=915059 RepID=A0A1S1YZT6_FLAPC|nr:CoA transferase [Flammeovirga pacifica]OHX66519.1 carnitine dehydratase [Flammeovirga pacifica]